MVVVTYELLHNHAPDETSVQRGVLLKKMKSKVRRNPSMPVRRVYDKCANDMDNDDYTPGFSNVRTRIKRIRSTFIPPIPRTVDDVSFNGTWAETWKGAKFLRHVDNDWGIAVFATKTMLEALAGVETMYIDGTFRTAPKPYSQFITVHGLVNGFVIPLAFCLATGKTIGQYRQLLQCLKRAVMRFCPGRNLAPGKTVIDFENSLMIAVETEFPMTRICCCYFHFNQSLWRHVQQLGLSGEYRRSYTVGKIIQMIMALGFLPVLVVKQNFQLLSRSRTVHRETRRIPQLEEWMQYVERTYVNPNSAFPPPLWNVYNRDINTRTNNYAEGGLSRVFHTLQLLFTLLV